MAAAAPRRFPVHTVSRRDYPPGWSGEIFTCDIDRTYLDTRFSSLKGIARIPFESALEKVTIAGMARLLKEIRRGPAETSRHTPIYFVSASPTQLRRVVEHKFLLDGVEFDGTTFKDWGGLLKRGRVRALKKHLSYKLAALLGNRSMLPPGAQEVLLGDDLEMDPLVYGLYADILSGRIPPRELPRVLEHNGASPEDARGVVELKIRAGNIEGGVRRALIRLERSADPEALIGFWPHLAPCRDALQMALVLWEQGSLSAMSVMRVARALRLFQVPAAEIEASLLEMVRRGLLGAEQVDELAALWKEHGVCTLQATLPAVDPAWEAVTGRAPGQPWTPRRYLGA